MKKTIKSGDNCPSGAGSEPQDPKNIKSGVTSCIYIYMLGFAKQLNLDVIVCPPQVFEDNELQM